MKVDTATLTMTSCALINNTAFVRCAFFLLVYDTCAMVNSLLFRMEERCFFKMLPL